MDWLKNVNYSSSVQRAFSETRTNPRLHYSARINTLVSPWIFQRASVSQLVLLTSHRELSSHTSHSYILYAWQNLFTKYTKQLSKLGSKSVPMNQGAVGYRSNVYLSTFKKGPFWQISTPWKKLNTAVEYSWILQFNTVEYLQMRCVVGQLVPSNVFMGAPWRDVWVWWALISRRRSWGWTRLSAARDRSSTRAHMELTGVYNITPNAAASLFCHWRVYPKQWIKSTFHTLPISVQCFSVWRVVCCLIVVVVVVVLSLDMISFLWEADVREHICPTHGPFNCQWLMTFIVTSSKVIAPNIASNELFSAVFTLSWSFSISLVITNALQRVLSSYSVPSRSVSLSVFTITSSAYVWIMLSWVLPWGRSVVVFPSSFTYKSSVILKHVVCYLLNILAASLICWLLVTDVGCVCSHFEDQDVQIANAAICDSCNIFKSKHTLLCSPITLLCFQDIFVYASFYSSS